MGGLRRDFRGSASDFPEGTRNLSLLPAAFTVGGLDSITALTADLSDLYRFALLLTGSSEAARDVLQEALTDLNGELTQFRNDRHRTVWFVAKVRERSLDRKASVTDGARDFAALFSQLPEPERSVLALFYLDFLTVRDIAHLLRLKIETVSGHLAEGREHLAGLMKESPEI